MTLLQLLQTRQVNAMKVLSFFCLLVIVQCGNAVGQFLPLVTLGQDPAVSVSYGPHQGRIDALQESIAHQRARVHVPFLGHKHEEFMTKREEKSRLKDSKKSPVRKGTFQHSLRVGLAGGLAGAAGTAILFPLDTAKTLRQSDPSLYKNVRSALSRVCYSDGHWHISRAYRGVIPSALGAIPSSALYFGAYESMKSVVKQVIGVAPTSMLGRLLVHSLSAASGNVLSSAVFVPKEAIKQQMQFMGNANMAQAAAQLCQVKGIQGLYSGYQATLLRNIPTAALRFTVYEEIKHLWLRERANAVGENNSAPTFDWTLFAAGAVAGIVASALMTPVDVVKTRISTGTCPVNMPDCAKLILRESGYGGLYAGAGSRMIGSGAFSAIGFGVFEAAKKYLGVPDSPASSSPTPGISHEKQRSSHPFTLRQRRLDHSLIDASAPDSRKAR